MDIGREFSDLGTLAAVVAHSQIIVALTAADDRRVAENGTLPDGFGDVDVAVLQWIAAEGRRVGRELARV